jgi:hypothetical protein
LFPETLYEALSTSPRICLACGWGPGHSVLRSTDREVVPLCRDCSHRWNFYGYEIFRGHGRGLQPAARPSTAVLVARVLAYKYVNWFRCPSLWSLYRGLRVYADWGEKMKRFRKGRKNG